MINIARDQAAKIGRILARTTATAFVHEEFSAVNILKHSRTRRSRQVLFERASLSVAQRSFVITRDQFSHLLPVDLGRSEAQLLFKCLFHYIDISVFAEDQRHHQPIVARTNLSIVAPVSEEGALQIASHVCRSPLVPV